MSDGLEELRSRVSREQLQRLREAAHTLQRMAGSRFGDEGPRPAAAREAEAVRQVTAAVAEVLYGEEEEG